MKLEGKVAVITGSGQGIGRGIALRFAQEGARVVINYPHSPIKVLQVLQEIDPSSQQAVTIQADVTVPEDTRRLIQGALDYFGQLDIVVNNAGIERKAPFWEVIESDYDAVMDVNVKGLFFVSQAAAKHWIDAQRPAGLLTSARYTKKFRSRGRLGRTEDVAGIAAFLASADADYLTGSTYFVDEGLTWHYEEQSGSGTGCQSTAPSA